MPTSTNRFKKIPHPGFTNGAHIKGYPDGTKEHPARNHPRAVSWLIEQHSKQGDLVWDPMMGSGTVGHEAAMLQRFACGWDLDPECRAQFLKIRGVHALENPADGSVKLIVTSPAFRDTNHDAGNNDKQREYTRKMRSTAGLNYRKQKIHCHLGQLSRSQEGIYWWILGNIYLRCARALAVGGKLVVILRDKIQEQKVYRYTLRNRYLIEFFGLQFLGDHRRKIPKGARWQQREKLTPGQKHVAFESALVFERVHTAEVPRP